MDLNLLVALRALLEEVNVTRAGARLNMPQSSMSAVLSRLRCALGDELLVQIGREFELTPFARHLLPEVQRTIPLIEQALGCEDTFDPATSTRTFVMTLSDHALPEWKPSICAVLEQAPGIHVKFEPVPAWQDHARKNPLRTDFLVIPPGHSPDGLIRGTVLRDTYTCLVDVKHPGLDDGQLSIDAFVRYPHVRTDFRTGHVSPVEQRLQTLGISPEYGASASSVLSLPLIVAGTDLIATIPSRMAALLHDPGRTVTVPTPFGEVELIEQLSWHESKHNDPAHRWFREALMESWQHG